MKKEFLNYQRQKTKNDIDEKKKQKLRNILMMKINI